jgi:hypothetical protein
MDAVTAQRTQSAAPALFALSVAQTDIWFAQRLDPESACYNLGGYFEVAAEIDPALLAAALRQAVAQIDSLRINFVATGDGPRQFFCNDLAVDVALIGFGDRSDPRGAALDWMRRDMDRPFDLSGGSLCRFALLRIADDRLLVYGCTSSDHGWDRFGVAGSRRRRHLCGHGGGRQCCGGRAHVRAGHTR